MGRMFIEAIHSKEFGLIFSFIVGLSIVAFVHPYCKDDECIVKKAPSIDEMKKNTYRIGNKCYQFTSVSKECPATGVIESFSCAQN